MEDHWPTPIPVSERLPEGERSVLIYTEASGWRMRSFSRGMGFDKDRNWIVSDEIVTHWLSLPPKP